MQVDDTRTRQLPGTAAWLLAAGLLLSLLALGGLARLPLAPTPARAAAPCPAARALPSSWRPPAP